jgi:hypothetical protein
MGELGWRLETDARMRRRALAVAAVLVLAVAAAWAVHRSRGPAPVVAAEGLSFDLAEEQTAKVGGLVLTLHGPPVAFALEVHDGASAYQPGVDRGSRFKMGEHLVEAKHAQGAEHVTVTVSAWHPTQPPTRADVETIAEEAARSRCGDDVARCRAMANPDGVAWTAACVCEGRSDTEEDVTVDAKSGAVLGVTSRGGA